jgi:hypothetical protein
VIVLLGIAAIVHALRNDSASARRE